MASGARAVARLCASRLQFQGCLSISALPPVPCRLPFADNVKRAPGSLSRQKFEYFRETGVNW